MPQDVWSSARQLADPLDDALRVKDMLSFWRAATVWVDGEPVDASMPGEA